MDEGRAIMDEGCVIMGEGLAHSCEVWSIKYELRDPFKKRGCVVSLVLVIDHYTAV